MLSHCNRKKEFVVLTPHWKTRLVKLYNTETTEFQMEMIEMQMIEMQIRKELRSSKSGFYKDNKKYFGLLSHI